MIDKGNSSRVLISMKGQSHRERNRALALPLEDAFVIKTIQFRKRSRDVHTGTGEMWYKRRCVDTYQSIERLDIHSCQNS